MQEKTSKSLLWHKFFGNFDTGVLFIFLSFLIWQETENMFMIAIAFMIPVFINTAVDFLFSNISDKYGRVKFIIIGNIGSALFLCFYGMASSLLILYGFIFLKSLFAKLYSTSLSPFIRESIDEMDFKPLVAKLNIRGSIGASVGGFTLMTIYALTENIALVFILSGLIELFSTLFLLNLKEGNLELKKVQEEHVDLKWMRDITIIYAFEAFGIALIVNRIVIFLHDYHTIELQNVGIIFFVVYGISNILAAQIYEWFAKVPIRIMLMISFVLQAIVLVIFARLNFLVLAIVFLFLFELINNITEIYTSDKINKSLFTNIGKRMSYIRITIALATIMGQLVVGLIWDRIGFAESFYFSSVVLIILTFIIMRYKLVDSDNKGF